MNARRVTREREVPASERYRVEQQGPAPRPTTGLRILLAHDARAATCDALARTIASSLTDVEIVDASSIADARLAAATESFNACFICLDLPPAPVAGVRLSSELLSKGYPVVLVTRSLRWVPPDKPALQQLPWIPPDARASDVLDAIAAVGGEFDSMIRPRAPSVDDLLTARVRR